ncbi:MAG: hypothetical protein ACRDMZ_09590, partial [Solirubrobacteraceae bacterium]
AAATSGPNLSRDDLATLRDRQDREIGQLTGDSPTADTAELGGRTITEANRSLALQGVSDPARAQLSALPWPEFSRLRGMSSADLDRVGSLPPTEFRDFIDGLAPHRRDEGNNGSTDDGSDDGDIDPTSGPSPTDGPTPTGPAPAGATTEPDRGGSAANVGDFRGDARRGPDLTPAHVRGTIDDNLRLIRPDGARYDAATQSFRLAGGERVEVRVGASRDGSVASFEFDPTTGHYVVTVSSRARDQDVVRALSHELAEIDAGRRDDVVLDNRNDQPDTLTTHLVGRYAEIRVLVDQMFQSRLTAQSDQTRRVEGDLRQLVDALGLNGPDAANRLRLLEQHDPDLLDRLRVIA